MAHPTTRHVMRPFCINDGLQVDHVASLSRFTPAAGSLRQLTINRLHPRAHRLHPETAYHRASQRTTEPHSVPQSLTAYHRASQRTTEPHSVPQSLTAYHRATQRTTVTASGKINVTFVQLYWQLVPSRNFEVGIANAISN